MVEPFVTDAEITSFLYSPNGVHLAVGLKSGDVEILDGEIGITLFILRESNWKVRVDEHWDDKVHLTCMHVKC